MKYKLVIRRGFEVLLRGELDTPKLDGGVRPSEERDFDKVIFEMEQAINAHTSLRAHIERA